MDLAKSFADNESHAGLTRAQRIANDLPDIVERYEAGETLHDLAAEYRMRYQKMKVLLEARVRGAMSEQRCVNCRFWNATGRWFGECRRNSPLRGDPVLVTRSCVWPTTGDDGWCGEFEEIPEEVKITLTHRP